jgi:hypothetical protein
MLLSPCSATLRIWLNNRVVTSSLEDAYGEDHVTEDQTVTLWAVCIAR